MGEYMDQREDLHALRYPPGSVIPVRGTGLPDGVIIEAERIRDISASSPEQIIRQALRVAMHRNDYVGIASLAAALHQITGEA